MAMVCRGRSTTPTFFPPVSQPARLGRDEAPGQRFRVRHLGKCGSLASAASGLAVIHPATKPRAGHRIFGFDSSSKSITFGPMTTSR